MHVSHILALWWRSDNTFVTDSGVHSLLASSLKLPSLHSLEIRAANVQGHGLQELRPFLQKHPHLKFLSLSHNAIGVSDDSLRHIADALELDALRFLHLGYNEINRGMVELAVAVQRSIGLRVLNLDANGITAPHFKTFVDKLLPDPLRGSLESLSLAHNQLGHLGMEAASQFLSNAPSVRTLNLAFNNVGNRGLQTLRTTIMHSATLQEIGLQGNDIGDEGVVVVADWIASNTALTTLDLADNMITNLGARQLQSSLEDNGQLTHLDLRGNGVTDASLLASIKSLLQRNKMGRGPQHINGAWGSWGICDRTCGSGRQFRVCNNPTASGRGAPCATTQTGTPLESQTRECFVKECVGTLMVC